VHEQDLVLALGGVGLVDAEGVDPDGEGGQEVAEFEVLFFFEV